MLDVGRVAFAAYRACIKERTGVSLPDWSEVDQTTQDAWRLGACAVMNYLENKFYYCNITGLKEKCNHQDCVLIG